MITRRPGLFLAVAFLAVAGAVPSAASAAKYHAFASCADQAPFPAATHCGFDRPGYSRTTFVFRSSVGKRDLKVCQRITGLPFHGEQCVKAERAKARQVIPCTVEKASNPFTVRVTFFVRKPGSQGAFRRVARVVLGVG